jgi:hypothetical protein
LGRSPSGIGFKGLQRQSPREQPDALAAGARLMELQHIRSVEQLHTGCSEPVDAGLKGRMLGLSGVDERQGHNREALPDGLGQQPKGQGVTDPSRPLVDRVEGGRRDHDGVRRRQHIGLIRLLVLRADRMAGSGLQGCRVDEAAGARRGNYAHVPAVGLGQLHQVLGVMGWRCSADNQVQHPRRSPRSGGIRRRRRPAQPRPVAPACALPTPDAAARPPAPGRPADSGPPRGPGARP